MMGKSDENNPFSFDAKKKEWAAAKMVRQIGVVFTGIV
jgi:hypothetical protein